jgi:hypothetical protein
MEEGTWLTVWKRPRSGMNLMHHLRELIRQRDAEAFAKELNLDPGQTRTWFNQGFTHDGYGVEVIKSVGAHALDRMLLTSQREEGHTHG